MKFVPADAQGGILLSADLASLRVGFLIKPAVHGQPFLRPRRTDQIDHHLRGGQRNAPPVARDVAEQAMLDFIPFAGARRIMADLDNPAGGIGEPLQFQLPQPCAMAITPPTVRRDEHPRRGGIARAPQVGPPLLNGVHGKLGRILRDADRDPGVGVREVIHPVGNGFGPLADPGSRAYRLPGASPWGDTRGPRFSCSPAALSSSYRPKSPGVRRAHTRPPGD